MFIRRFLENRRNKQIGILKAKKEAIDSQKKDAELSISIATESMLSAPCGINNMDKCRADCVHFCAGKFSRILSTDTYLPSYYSISFPRCRLWG